MKNNENVLIISSPLTKLLDRAYFKLKLPEQLYKRKKEEKVVEIKCLWNDVCDLIKEAYEIGYEDGSNYSNNQ